MENTVYGMFTAMVKQQPDAPAIIENKRTLTFKELSAMVDMIADSFPDNTRAVGIVMRHRAEMIASILAALKTGAMYIPAEPSFPIGRIHYMMEEAHIDFVLTEMQYTSKLEGFEQIYSDCSICTAAPGSKSRVYTQQPDDSRMYHSGDLGYILPDGNIGFLHRMDTQIMIYGKRVEVMEVESKLYQCSGVEQAIVRPFTDEEGLSYMIAYVVPSKKDLKVSQVRKELSENLTSFMIPEFIVKMPQIPLNVNGKPDMTRMPVVMKEGQAYERIG